MTPELHHRIKCYLATNPPGWAWEEKCLKLAAHASVGDVNLVVEIGVFGGRSLVPMALALRWRNCGIAYGIDPWRKDFALEGMDQVADAAHIDWWSHKVDLDAIYRTAQRDIYDNGLSRRCVLLRMTSQEAAPLFSPREIDLLHIDGQHTELVSCRDVTTWVPLVRQGGIICFDDTNWASTQKAVGMLAAACDHLETLTSEAGGECRFYRKL